MRILHCVPAMGSGGAERQLAYLAGEQRRQGHEVDVALICGGPNLERLQRSGASLHFLAAVGNHDPRILVGLIRLIRSSRPDIVQTWLTQMDVLGGIAAMSCRVPWVLSERNSGLAYPNTLKNRLRKLVGGRANAVVCNSFSGVEYWHTRASHLIPTGVIPNPLPLDEIDSTHAASDEEIDIAPQQRLCLFVGRLVAQKQYRDDAGRLGNGRPQCVICFPHVRRRGRGCDAPLDCTAWSRVSDAHRRLCISCLGLDEACPGVHLRKPL